MLIDPIWNQMTQAWHFTWKTVHSKMLWLLTTSITVSLKWTSNIKMKNTLISRLDPLLFQLDMLRQMDAGWYYQNHFHSEFQASPQAKMREREKINQLPTVIYTRKFTLNKFIYAPLLEEWPLEEENKCSLVWTLALCISLSLSLSFFTEYAFPSHGFQCLELCGLLMNVIEEREIFYD